MALPVTLRSDAADAVANARELVLELVGAGVPAPPFGTTDDELASELVIAGIAALFTVVQHTMARTARDGMERDVLEAIAASDCKVAGCPVHGAVRGALDELRKAGA